MIRINDYLIKNMENFPKNTKIAEIQIRFRHEEQVTAINIMSGNNLGQWTTKPISSLWSIAVISKTGELKVLNNSKRFDTMDIPPSHHLTLWIADNGSLSACPLLSITIQNSEGKIFHTSAACRLN